MAGAFLLSEAVEGFIMARIADRYSLSTTDQYKWGLRFLLLSVGDISLKSVSKQHIRELFCLHSKPVLYPMCRFFTYGLNYALKK
jgi:hypothetical protein